MEIVKEDMVFACSARRHGLENQKLQLQNSHIALPIDVDVFSNFRKQIVRFKYENLEGHCKCLDQTNCTDEEDDESAFIKL